jgi:hypothetical protein
MAGLARSRASHRPITSLDDHRAREASISISLNHLLSATMMRATAAALLLSSVADAQAPPQEEGLIYRRWDGVSSRPATHRAGLHRLQTCFAISR